LSEAVAAPPAVPVKHVHERQAGNVAGIVREVIGHIHTTEAPGAGKQPFALERGPCVHRIGWFLIAEFHGVLEHLDEA
jgi:hypothetical protein